MGTRRAGSIEGLLVDKIGRLCAICDSRLSERRWWKSAFGNGGCPFMIFKRAISRGEYHEEVGLTEGTYLQDVQVVSALYKVVGR